MKIVTVQIAAQLGQLETNIEKTDKLLEGLTPDDVDFLVLPELAFSGQYPFPSHLGTCIFKAIYGVAQK